MEAEKYTDIGEDDSVLEGSRTRWIENAITMEGSGSRWIHNKVCWRAPGGDGPTRTAVCSLLGVVGLTTIMF